MTITASEKLAKALDRGYFRTIDLFAGCGGLTLGFDRADFKSIGCIEINEFARRSHITNFGEGSEDGYRAFSDIRKTKPSEAVAHLIKNKKEKVSDVVDVVIGGPPCQAFSRLGRAALWRLAGEDLAHGHDERATYYHDFIKYVSELQPLAFVMENVREIGKFVGRNIAEEIAATAEELGYETRYSLLNAVWYGVPQLRERMFIIGIKKELGQIPEFPKIRHEYDLPVGYSTSRAGMGHYQVLPPYNYYVDHAERERTLKPATSVSDAFADLPPLYHHLDGRAGKGNRREIEKEFEYTQGGNFFTKEMRTWPGFKSSKHFKGHVIRYTPRDYETFRRMKGGDMYPEALLVAEKIFAEKIESIEKERGTKIRKGSRLWEDIWKKTVPPYKVNRYPNKFRKMSPNEAARTVPAHIGKDSYSHIHFDSKQARCISLREAARLQSFPDAFDIQGSMNAQLTQIGNAVPPLLAYAVAKNLRKQLEESRAGENIFEAAE